VTATRRLAAILAADVVGYSRLMGDDEAGTAKVVRERREAATPIVRAFGGRLVKTTGDGVLLEFPSVVAAVECAVAIQKMMAERNAALPEARRILYRVGVNLGDILVEGDDILGDGVNVAARLEGICDPGAICLSDDAYRQAHGRIEAEFADLGEQELKNIAKPMRVYAVTPQAIAVAKAEVPAIPPAPQGAATPAATPKARFLQRWPALAAALAALLVVIAGGAWWFLNANRPASVAAKTPAEAARLSIVVLPFANLSGDPGQDYLVDALTDELTTSLARIHDTFVIAHNTAMTFKGKAVDAKAIGKELGVRYVLEGSVQPTGDRMRVNANHDPGEAYVSQHVGLVRPSDQQLSAWLLLCLMADAGGRAELVERAYGAGKPGLNLDNIRSLSIPLPPLAEQHRIVAKVDALMALCDRLEASLTATAATRRRLLDALLAEALAPAEDRQREAAE
jgi:adenylate cyclase